MTTLSSTYYRVVQLKFLIKNFGRIPIFMQKFLKGVKKEVHLSEFALVRTLQIVIYSNIIFFRQKSIMRAYKNGVR
jgi:hypothetical protein